MKWISFGTLAHLPPDRYDNISPEIIHCPLEGGEGVLKLLLGQIYLELDPVRMDGWIPENKRGLTVETMDTPFFIVSFIPLIS